MLKNQKCRQREVSLPCANASRTKPLIRRLPAEQRKTVSAVIDAFAVAHPLLVLSPKAFNANTGLVIGLPMSTAAYNASNPFAVRAGSAVTKTKAQADSYVLCHQPKSFDWRARGGKLHPSKRIDDATLATACLILNQMIDIG